MKKLSLIRIATYIVFVGIVISMQHQIGVVPVHLLSDDEVETLESEPERRKADRIIVSSAGFRNAKLSGSEVTSIAEKKAREADQNLDQFIPPNIALRVLDGRLYWIVFYRATFGPVQFEIRIDDSTGIASLEDTTAPM